tara:strand:+ start:300 stop:920 length:621 start_codon:yes stop_codon:yes gene_type:complete
MHTRQQTIKDLKAKAEEWEDYFNSIAVRTQGQGEEIERLLEENKKLKEEVEEWKESCSGYVDTPDELEMWMSASIHEDEEEYSKYMEPLELRDEVKKLKEESNAFQDAWIAKVEENKTLKQKFEDETCWEEFQEVMDKLKEQNKKLKEDDKHADNYWRCIMDHLSNPDNPDVDFIKPWASDDGLNEEDTEELLNNFGYYEEDPTDK